MQAKRSLTAVGALLLVVALLPVTAYAAPSVVNAEHSYVVSSGSMQPALRTGDIVFVNEVPPQVVERGDVITFEPPAPYDPTAATITHRVVDVRRTEEGLVFRTKGDNNEHADASPVPAENVVGRVTYRIPLGGYVVSFLSTVHGLALFVVSLAGLGARLRTRIARRAGRG